MEWLGGAEIRIRRTPGKDIEPGGVALATETSITCVTTPEGYIEPAGVAEATETSATWYLFP